jgi:hypothetical protein
MDSIVPAAALSVASLVSNVLSSAKAAKELAKQSGDTDLKEQIGDLIDSVLEVKQRVLELDEENRSLRQQLAQKGAVRRDSQFGYYFGEGDPDPLCPKCYESAAKLIHLTQAKTWSGGVRRDCRECRQVFWEVPLGTNSIMGRVVPMVNRY